MAETWIKRNGDGIVTGLIVCIVWAAIAYLAKIASPWFYPLFYGFVTGCVVLIAAVSVIILRRIPRRQIVPTEKNIGTFVRAWLDNHKFTVKNDPCEEAYFRLQITLDSNWHMTVLRSKSVIPGYVQIIADLGVRGNDKKLLEQFTDDERTKLFFDIKMELARAKVGYSGLVDPPETFQIFRNVPIYSSLTEFAFISMIGDVEASMNLVALRLLQARWSKERSPLDRALLSRSDAPVLEPSTT